MKILHEDDFVIVIDKPAGLLTTHTKLVGRAAREAQLTAENVLTDYVRKGQWKSSKRVWLVHRLDRETSGVMMFAKSERIAAALRERWGEVTEKTYLARVEGRLSEDAGTFESFLREDADGYRVRSVPSGTPGAKRAKTAWRVRRGESAAALARAVGFGPVTRETELVEVTLHTGRKNQIRVHFSEAGHPVVGDVKYGAARAPRLCLHAWRLAFDHPVTGRRLTFESDGGTSGGKILIVGYGASGRAAEALAGKLGHEVEVVDEKSAIRLSDAAFAFAVVSPGVPLSSPLIAACRSRRIPLKSELQFGCEELKRRGWKLLAVTGSKGKSSVVKLCADALGGVSCGNYGRPVCDVALQAFPPGWAVVEVSSFQMETTELPADTFAAAAVLNLQEDHLDRHGSVATYHALKRHLLDFAKVGFVGEEDVRVSSAAPVDLALLSDSYFDNEILRLNGLLAVQLLRAAGLPDAAIRTAFLRFEPLPHRFQRIAEIGGVVYVDDSKATSLAALVAGVRMCVGPVRLIAGGLAKGDDPKIVLSTLTKRVKKVYLIGRCAGKFFAAWNGRVDCEIVDTLDCAVRAAKRESIAGETVLLSPGTASFDQFKSFGERGEVFARLVKNEGKTNE